MQLQEHKKVYVAEDEIFSFQDTLLDNISFKVFIICSKEKFPQYQKDIFEEFVADFTNVIKTSEELDIDDIREIFEQHLQLLNTKLKQFAEKVKDIEHFHLKWVVQVVVDEKLMTSLIGDVSMMIMREQKIIYSIQNNVDTKLKIDICSDFVEWAIERDDQILYVWQKFSDIMDAHDLKEMENLLVEEEDADWVLSFIEDLFVTRVEKSNIWFIISYFIKWHKIKITRWASKWWLKLKWVKGKSQQYINELWEKFQNSELIQSSKKKLLENKIYFVGLVLTILILVFVYALLSQIINNSKSTNKFQTGEWYVEINIDDLQEDISVFKSLDPSSPLKTSKYNEISDKLSFLEAQWKWLEDVADLKTQLEDNFYDGFNIKQFKSESDLDNIAWRNTKILTFNSAEIEKLWDLNSINVPRNMMIAWSKWAMIDASSDTNRGHFQSYDLTKPLQDCISALNSNGIYCYNDSWEIYMISKSWIVPVQTEEWNFRTWIWWLWTFSSKNLYVFKSNISDLDKMLLTRYQTNNDWTYANFKAWTSYSVNASGVDFWTFSSFAIDGNFLWRSNGKMYQFWRDNLAWSSLNYREIPVEVWNPLNEKYSDNIKIITSNATRYVFIYDRDQQLFTAYNSVENKLNDQAKLTYSLKYMFSLKFDIEWVKIYDADIPASTWDRPELYLLTSSGVNKIALYEYIEALAK